MPIDNPEYDVAISFLSRDEAIAAAIDRRLSEGLKVFFYPQRQRELAGTDGLESMRKAFFDESRVMVVLYRDGWGATPWTRVEETAIKESCLAYGWHRLLFIVLEKQGTLPVWLPRTHIRLNYTDFGLDQAVGAIRERVHENGGKTEPLTAVRRAALFKADELRRREQLLLNTPDGMRKILRSVGELLQELESRCLEINSKDLLTLRYTTEPGDRSYPGFRVTNDSVGITVEWCQPYSNILDNSALKIFEYNSSIILHREQRMYIMGPPKPLHTDDYHPEVSLTMEYGWRKEGEEAFVSNAALAERCIIRLVELEDEKHRSRTTRR